MANKSIDSRIEKLEKANGTGKSERKTWVVVEGEPMPDGVGDTDIILRVRNEEAREGVQRVIAGERTE